MRSSKLVSLALALCSFAALLSPEVVRATPSTTYWAPSTAYLQPFGVLHVTYDTYFNRKTAYGIDTGLEIGVLPWAGFQAEIGFDLVYPTFSKGEPMDLPILLNAKIGAPEDVYFKGCPGWSAGIFGVGFEEDVTDYNVLHLMLGKTLPIGYLSAGIYYGLNPDLMRSADGDDQRFGAMFGWISPNIDLPVIDHINFTADIQTGANVLAAVGGGVYFYFTPTIDLLVGPVFFLEPDLQPGRSAFMWTVQLDVDLDLK